MDPKDEISKVRSILINDEHVMLRSKDGILLFLDKDNNIISKNMVSTGGNRSSLIHRVSLVNARSIQEVNLSTKGKGKGKKDDQRPKSMDMLE